jgi:phage terminase large subunit
VSDSTAIWFTQYDKQRNIINIIDYIEDFGKGNDFYIKEVKNKPYIYNSHNAPFDIKNREQSDGISRLQKARDYGINFNVIPKPKSRQEGIDKARSIFSRCIFNKLTCEKGFKALKNYRRGFNERLNKFSDEPIHDWSSHGADAFRYMAVQVERLQNLNQQTKKPSYAIT